MTFAEIEAAIERAIEKAANGVTNLSELLHPYEQARIQLFWWPEKIAVCECGAKKLGHADYSPGHAIWCPVTLEET